MCDIEIYQEKEQDGHIPWSHLQPEGIRVTSVTWQTQTVKPLFKSGGLSYQQKRDSTKTGSYGSSANSAWGTDAVTSTITVTPCSFSMASQRIFSYYVGKCKRIQQWFNISICKSFCWDSWEVRLAVRWFIESLNCLIIKKRWLK